MNTTLNIDDDKRAEDLGRKEEVSVAELHSELQMAVDDGNQFVVRCADSYANRWCIWEGQSSDGRKHAKDLGKEPFPWEGSSDTRIRLADEIINDHALIMTAALMRSRMQAAPGETTDARMAAAYSTFLKWLFATKMKKVARREGKILGNWQELYGHAVLAVTWDQGVRIVKKTVRLEDLQSIAADAASVGDEQGQMALEMLDAIWDEEREEEVAAWLRSLHGLLSPSGARAAVRSLRLEGTMEVPRPEATKNQPCWTACRPFRDIFYPANTCDLDAARWVAFREVLPPGDLHARILTQGYDEEAVEEACENFIGSSVLESVHYDKQAGAVNVIDEMKGMIEVFCFYRRVTDDQGFVKIMATEFCPGAKMALYERETDYTCYPFVEFVSNRTERILIENRAVPERCDTQQTEVKTSRDYRSDRSSIAISPPVQVPIQRTAVKLNFGPNSQVPVRKTGDVEWMRPPAPDPDTGLLEAEIRANVDNYFGRLSDKVHPARQSLYNQQRVDEWLGNWNEVGCQTLALCRQYMTDEEFARITGVAMPFQTGELTGPDEYDISIEFNAQDLNSELVGMKLEAINKMVLPADTMGVIDRGILIQWAMQAIDPTLANAVVRPASAAANAEIEDEQVQFAKLFAGTEPEMKQGGQNAALRLQTLQTIVARNPNIQQRLSIDEVFAKMMEARMQHFQFLLQQEQNAQIGRVGAQPALDEVDGPPGAMGGMAPQGPGGGAAPQGPNGAAPQELGAPAPQYAEAA